METRTAKSRVRKTRAKRVAAKSGRNRLISARLLLPPLDGWTAGERFSATDDWRASHTHRHRHRYTQTHGHTPLLLKVCAYICATRLWRTEKKEMHAKKKKEKKNANTRAKRVGVNLRRANVAETGPRAARARAKSQQW